ncbi:HAD hydrolase family protein [Aeromonas caviae]|uniref:HAD hydrolase family protein n=1 Tax=Aeromonas allosaccharophila TaxID=656 RepID=A0AAX3NZ00_9GAMM|nr:HAD hydrolase family protein [Aeromonas allosaccharophila]WED79361.1 HAD hydrolase family protein [Aeromonas allosaccharophila]
MKKIVIDLDGTLTIDSDTTYCNKPANKEVINRLVEYKASGYAIIIFTSRNMRTYDGNIGKMNIHTLPTIIEWLNNNGVPYDEVILGKPWCGFEGFYVDDKSIRPSEFASLSCDQIKALLDKENPFKDGGNK